MHHRALCSLPSFRISYIPYLFLFALWCACTSEVIYLWESASKLVSWMIACWAIITEMIVLLGMNAWIQRREVIRCVHPIVGLADSLATLGLFVSSIYGLILLLTSEELPAGPHYSALTLIVVFLLYDLLRLSICMCSVCLILPLLLRSNLPENSANKDPGIGWKRIVEPGESDSVRIKYPMSSSQWSDISGLDPGNCTLKEDHNLNGNFEEEEKHDESMEASRCKPATS